MTNVKAKIIRGQLILSHCGQLLNAVTVRIVFRVNIGVVEI